jgi:hypothetical protein
MKYVRQIWNNGIPLIVRRPMETDMASALIEPFGEPLDVTVEGGEVVLSGPDGIAGSFTPRAAAESGRRLIEAAEEAGRAAPRRTDFDGEAPIRS